MGCAIVMAAWGGIVVAMRWSEGIAMWSGMAIGIFVTLMYVGSSLWAAIKVADSMWWRAVFVSILVMIIAGVGVVIAGVEDTEVLELLFLGIDGVDASSGDCR